MKHLTFRAPTGTESLNSFILKARETKEKGKCLQQEKKQKVKNIASFY